MLTCLHCSRTYTDDTLNFCLEDGTPLVGAVAGSDDPATTARTAVLETASGHNDTSATQLFNEPLEVQQQIRYCSTTDGLNIAYSVVGKGPLLVRVLGHFTHLEREWEWPEMRRFWERLAENFTVVRYDGRGIGLSDHYKGEYTEETRQLDLGAVLDAIGAEEATLLGISEGGWTAAAFANSHPERVIRLVLYGAYARGEQSRPNADREMMDAVLTLVRKGWGKDTPAFRQFFTSQFFPYADAALIARFNEMQRAAADPDTAERYYRSLYMRGDGQGIFREVKMPALVIHSQDDTVVSSREGRLLAAIIPGAQLVLLPSGMHYFPTDPESATRVVHAITRFAGAAKG